MDATDRIYRNLRKKDIAFYSPQAAPKRLSEAPSLVLLIYSGSFDTVRQQEVSMLVFTKSYPFLAAFLIFGVLAPTSQAKLTSVERCRNRILQADHLTLIYLDGRGARYFKAAASKGNADIVDLYLQMGANLRHLDGLTLNKRVRKVVERHRRYNDHQPRGRIHDTLGSLSFQTSMVKANLVFQPSWTWGNYQIPSLNELIELAARRGERELLVYLGRIKDGAEALTQQEPYVSHLIWAMALLAEDDDLFDVLVEGAGDRNVNPNLPLLGLLYGAQSERWPDWLNDHDRDLAKKQVLAKRVRYLLERGLNPKCDPHLAKRRFRPYGKLPEISKRIQSAARSSEAPNSEDNDYERGSLQEQIAHAALDGNLKALVHLVKTRNAAPLLVRQEPYLSHLIWAMALLTPKKELFQALEKAGGSINPNLPLLGLLFGSERKSHWPDWLNRHKRPTVEQRSERVQHLLRIGLNPLRDRDLVTHQLYGERPKDHQALWKLILSEQNRAHPDIVTEAPIVFADRFPELKRGKNGKPTTGAKAVWVDPLVKLFDRAGIRWDQVVDGKSPIDYARTARAQDFFRAKTAGEE